MIPPFQNYLLPFLRFMADGKTRKIVDVINGLASTMNLSEEDLSETLDNSGKNRHADRCSWAKTYLSKAGLIRFPKRANFVITADGQKLLASGISEISRRYLLENYPSFGAFIKKKGKKGKKNNVDKTEQNEEDTPLERMEEAYKEYTNKTIDDLLDSIKGQKPQFFENLVVQLLVKMGYGGDFEDSAKVTQYSCDGGIDGVIKEDALGLDRIYIQAKRWSDKVVGAPDIQQFIGALVNVGATKGIYITASHFSEAARKAARTGHLKIVLIDGEQLARYMIEYGLGVITARSFEVKRLDFGYFHPEEE